MLIGTTFAAVLFCGACGRMHLDEVSAFVLHAKEHDIFCVCGKRLGCLKAVKKDEYMLALADAEDGGTQAVRFSRKLIRTGKVYPFFNLRRREEGGFIGSPQAVRAELETAAKMAAREGADVTDPQVMFEVINKLDDLAVEGSICCGSCGRHEIGIKVFSSVILLYCDCCGNRYEIRAKYQEDVKYIRKIDFIELAPIGQ